MPANGKPNGRFELPQFTPLNFSLTDGTDIPPPPDSPIHEKPPPVAPQSEVVEEAVASATNGSANGTVNGATSTNGVYDGRGRTNGAVHTSVSADHRPPMSPVSATRPSSIRRFLSRKSLNTNYENGTNSNTSHEDLTSIDRPESSMSFTSGRPEKRSRPSWFRRFSSNHGGKRTSVIYEEKRSSIMPTIKGPPPPKLPELSKLKAQMVDDDGSLGGGEMFKNIK